MKKRLFSLLLAAVLLLTLLPQLPIRSQAHQVVMTADQFISCLWTAYNRPNVYRNSYPYNLGYYDGSVIYFDCWNLGKAIIWSRGAIVNNYTVGHHATMDASCGLGDWDGLSIVRAAPNCSSDFSNLVPGEWLYMDNHTGYYVGNGQVIECTAGWNVWGITISQIDKYGNRSRNGVSGGSWKLHGMVPWLDYSQSTLDGHEPIDLGDDFYAYVKHTYSGCYLTNSGGNVCVKNGIDDNANQLFRFVRQAENGSYSIGLPSTGQWMDVTNENYTDFSNIRMYTGNGSYSQKFYIYYINGRFVFRAMFNDKTLAVDGSNGNVCLYGSSAGAVDSMEYNSRGFDIYKLNLDYSKVNTCVAWDFPCYIRQKETGKLLTAEGDNAVFREPTYSQDQLWNVTRNEYGGNVIKSMVNGKVLDVYGGSLEAGTSIDLYEPNGTKAQSFFVIPQGYSSYWYIKPCYTNTVMSVGSNGEIYSNPLGTSDSQKVLQQFEFITEHHLSSDEIIRDPVSMGDSFTAQVHLHGTTTVLTDHGDSVSMEENTQSENQFWNFTYDSATKAYKITGSSGKVFDSKDGGYKNSTAMVMADSNDSLSQRFRFYDAEYGYILSPAHAQRVVDVKDDGTTVQLYQSFVDVSRLFDLTVVSYNGQEPLDLGESFTSSIQNIASGLYVTESNKDPMVCTDTATQWNFTRKDNGAYTVTSVSTGKAMEVGSGYISAGSNIKLYDANDTRAQDYFIYNTADGYVLMSSKSVNVLDMSADTKKLHIYGWGDSETSVAAHSFALEGAPLVGDLTLKADSRLIRTDGYVKNISAGMTAAQLIDQFDNDGVVICDSKGNEVTAGTVCATGYQVQLTVRDTCVDSLELVVAGDVDGSGQVDVTDYMRVRATMLGSFDLEGAYFQAGDVDSTGYINTTDYMRIRAYFLGTYELYE